MFNTLPYNYFPASTAKFEEGKNDAIQAEIDAIKDGTNIDSFGDVETALSLKVNSADMETALATKTNLSNIAPTFDSESGTYDIGEQIIYEGVLYEFISAHDTPGDWDSTEVQAVKISELIDTLNSNLTTIIDGLLSPISASNKIAMSDAYMANHDIGADYTIDDLASENHVTWFTNWSDSTNFPQIYGSGVLIPGKDTTQKAVIYICIGANGGDVYTNSYINNAWGSWRKLQFTS